MPDRLQATDNFIRRSSGEAPWEDQTCTTLQDGIEFNKDGKESGLGKEREAGDGWLKPGAQARPKHGNTSNAKSNKDRLDKIKMRGID
ncbi:hypothetical protein TESG_08421 [Trichophyton tonsurans CBS 112818]|uniref:Uncharacterized protein n=1 Tax=Trichophyton tonsurans (strain CBS 112818) TaxID=647933 RepID=F2RXP5_TRIT1|nr:hypothetical protein TESG_08421 [Trichophyton tonsurans CBS 112818]